MKKTKPKTDKPQIGGHSTEHLTKILDLQNYQGHKKQIKTEKMSQIGGD